MINVLYGDGIHDDTAAIQELLDTCAEVALPLPRVCYLISKPLILHKNQKLSLPRFAEIKLADGSNCFMLKNETRDDYAERTDIAAFSFVNFYSPDAPIENIEISGGIWNFNNKNQKPNPQATRDYTPDGYVGFGFLFYNVRGLRLTSLTLKDPVNFAVMLDTVSYFSIDNVTFDYNDGNPYQANMDGIHLDGNCHHGQIEKLYGTCYDDIVALNADEGSCGPISDITIRGIYTDRSYSAVRLLSARPECSVSNVHISDVYGTFYHFTIALMKNYNTGKRGRFENVTIENVFASKSDRSLVNHPYVFNYPDYAIIDVAGDLDIKNLKISNVHRREKVDTEKATLKFYENCRIDNLIIDNVTTENCKNADVIPFIENDAEINGLTTSNLYYENKPFSF